MAEAPDPLDESWEAELPEVDWASPPVEVRLPEVEVEAAPLPVAEEAAPPSVLVGVAEPEAPPSVPLGAAEPEVEPVGTGLTMTVVDPSGVTLVDVEALCQPPDWVADEGPTSEPVGVTEPWVPDCPDWVPEGATVPVGWVEPEG